MSYTGDHNDEIKRVLNEASKNLQLSSSDIQKDLINAAATDTTNAILEENRNTLFVIFINEDRDVSIKEQMTIVLRYVNKKCVVVERFISVVHVKDTSAKSLKK